MIAAISRLYFQLYHLVLILLPFIIALQARSFKVLMLMLYASAGYFMHVSCFASGTGAYNLLCRKLRLMSTLTFRRMFARIVRAYFTLLHGYDVQGIELIPCGPVIFVGHHSRIAIVDAMAFMSRLLTERDHPVTRVGVALYDKLSNKPAVVKYYLEAMHCIGEGHAACKGALKKGTSLLIFPGGSDERLAANTSYCLNDNWEGRNTFAHLAMDVKVPVVPIFTKNANHTHVRVPILPKFVWKFVRGVIDDSLYVGYVPAKLVTYIGEPIDPAGYKNAADLATAARLTVEALRDRHQTTGFWGYFAALKERVMNAQTPVQRTNTHEDTEDGDSVTESDGEFHED